MKEKKGVYLEFTKITFNVGTIEISHSLSSVAQYKKEENPKSHALEPLTTLRFTRLSIFATNFPENQIRVIFREN